MNETTIRTKTAEPSYTQQQVQRFLAECTEPDAYSSVQVGRLFARYQQWCWKKKEHAVPANLYPRLVRQCGIRRSYSTGKCYWRGIRIIEEEEVN